MDLISGGRPKQATKGYSEFVAIATEKAGRLEQRDGSEGVSEMVARETSEHLLSLYSAGRIIPLEASEAVVQAREVSSNARQHALRSLVREKPLRAVEINFETIENGLGILQTQVNANDTEEVTLAANEIAKLFELGEEITKTAQELGVEGATIDSIVAKSSSIHLSVLIDIYEEIPEKSKPIMLRAMQTSIRSHQKAMESLAKKGIVFSIPENAPASKVVPAELEESFISKQPRIYQRKSLTEEPEGLFGIRINEAPPEPGGIEEKHIDSVYATEHELRRVKVEATETVHDAELRLSNLRTEAKKAIFAAEAELKEAIEKAEKERGELIAKDELLEVSTGAEDAVRQEELNLQEIKVKYAKAIEEAEKELHEARVRAEKAAVEAEHGLETKK